MFEGSNFLSVDQHNILIEKFKCEQIKVTGDRTFFCQPYIDIPVMHHDRNTVPCEMNIKFEPVDTIILIIQYASYGIFGEGRISDRLYAVMRIYFEGSVYCGA